VRSPWIAPLRSSQTRTGIWRCAETRRRPREMKAFERGVALTRDCQKALKDAELRVQALTDTEQGLGLEDVDADEFEHDDDV